MLPFPFFYFQDIVTLSKKILRIITNERGRGSVAPTFLPLAGNYHPGPLLRRDVRDVTPLPWKKFNFKGVFRRQISRLVGKEKMVHPISRQIGPEQSLEVVTALRHSSRVFNNLSNSTTGY